MCIAERKILFHTDYDHLRKEDLNHFPHLFAHVKEYLKKAPICLEHKLLLEELFSRNETTFINRYLRKARFESIPTVPIKDFLVSQLIYNHFSTISEEVLRELAKETKKYPYGSFERNLIKKFIRHSRKIIEHLVARYINEKTPQTIQLVEGTKFVYGLLNGEMSFAISPFGDRIVFHNMKRAQRPIAAEEPACIVDREDLEKIEKENPFAKNNELRTPVELVRVNEDGELQWFTPAEILAYNTKRYAVRVVPNLYPGIVPSCFSDREKLAEDEAKNYNKYISSEEGAKHLAFLASKVGESKVLDFFRKTFHHHVVIDHPDMFIENARSLEDYNHIGAMSRKHCNKILKALMKVREYDEQDPAVNYVLIFKNWKGEAGASIPKSHHQILATPNVPTEILKQVQMAKIHGNKFFEDMLDFYESCGFLIAKKGKARAYSCPWPDYPGTIEIYLRGKEVNRLEDLNKEDSDDFYGLLHIILAAIGGKGAHNYFFCDTPKNEKKGLIPVSIKLNTREKNNKAGAELAGVPLSAYPPDIYAKAIADLIMANAENYATINGSRHYANLEVFLQH